MALYLLLIYVAAQQESDLLANLEILLFPKVSSRHLNEIENNQYFRNLNECGQILA